MNHTKSILVEWVGYIADAVTLVLFYPIALPLYSLLMCTIRLNEIEQRLVEEDSSPDDFSIEEEERNQESFI